MDPDDAPPSLTRPLAHVALAVIQIAEFLALQEFDIAIQNRKRGLEIVGGRSKCIGGAEIALAELRIFLHFLRLGSPTLSPQATRGCRCSIFGWYRRHKNLS